MVKKWQHYIPQFYLKKFGKPTYRFDKTNDSIKQRNPRTIGMGKNFYDIDGLPHGTIEDLLSKNEDKFSKAYYRLIETQDLAALTKEQKTNFFLFLGSQFLRTTEIRYMMDQMSQGLFERIFGKKGMNIIPGNVQAKLTENSLKIFQTSILIDAVPKIALLLSKKTWIIRENTTQTLLWTSDNPIALHNDYDLGNFGNMGILSPGIEIHFPLTPNLILLSYDPLVTGITTDPIDSEHVLRHNCYQVESSVRYLFSRNNDFQDAIDYLNKYPDLRDPKRSRGKFVN